MMPFKQTESGMTKTALVLAPADGQTYCAPIQQNPLREKLNTSLVVNNVRFFGGPNVL